MPRSAWSVISTQIRATPAARMQVLCVSHTGRTRAGTISCLLTSCIRLSVCPEGVSVRTVKLQPVLKDTGSPGRHVLANTVALSGSVLSDSVVQRTRWASLPPSFLATVLVDTRCARHLEPALAGEGVAFFFFSLLGSTGSQCCRS